MPRRSLTPVGSNHFRLVNIIFTTVILSSLVNSITPLTCSCNVCGENRTSCTTAPHNASKCFKKVERDINEKGEAEYYAEYGCISGSDSSLGTLQCHTMFEKFVTLTFMRCCGNKDNCNDEIPDPTEKDDPRWDISEQPEPQNQYPIWWVGLVAVPILGSILMYILSRILYNFVRTKLKQRKIRGNESVCSLQSKSDHDKHSAGGSESTRSCSMSDSLSHKPDQLAREASSLFVDLTSGIGLPMLNERTMARAIGMGKTDHVGDGRFGRVFRGEYHGDLVAVKAFKSIDHDSWQREDTIFRSLNHENIVRFISSEVTSMENNVSEIWMFLEYCQYGSLHDYLDHNEVCQQQAVTLLLSIINGLNYLHEDFCQGYKPYKRAIAHRDIKSRNILMKTPYSCCIADFGHALIKIDENHLDYGNYTNLRVGTIRYMAPEILHPDPMLNLNFKQFSVFASADLYQYGLIMWEVCFRTAIDIVYPAGDHKLPYDGKVPQNPGFDDMIAVVCIEQYRPPRLEHWEQYPIMRRLSELMVECWRPNPKARMETLGVKKKMKELDKYVTEKHYNHHRQTQFGNFFESNLAIDS